MVGGRDHHTVDTVNDGAMVRGRVGSADSGTSRVDAVFIAVDQHELREEVRPFLESGQVKGVGDGTTADECESRAWHLVSEVDDRWNAERESIEGAAGRATYRLRGYNKRVLTTRPHHPTPRPSRADGQAGVETGSGSIKGEICELNPWSISPTSALRSAKRSHTNPCGVGPDAVVPRTRSKRSIGEGCVSSASVGLRDARHLQQRDACLEHRDARERRVGHIDAPGSCAADRSIHEDVHAHGLEPHGSQRGQRRCHCRADPTVKAAGGVFRFFSTVRIDVPSVRVRPTPPRHP